MNDRSKEKTKRHEKSVYEKSISHQDLWEFVKRSQGKDIKPFKKIILNWKAYRRIVGYSIRYAHDEMKSNQLKEVYGILIGLIKEESVIIKDAIPMISGDRAGVEYENKQYVDMAQIDASIHEQAIKDKENEFIIGWWHTHPGFGFFFSPIDSITQLGYQVPNPHAIGLIFDHTKKNNNSLGIAALRLKNANRGALATYEIINLNYHPKKSSMLKKIDKIIVNIKKNMKLIEENIKYIQNSINNKSIAQLQEKYGLIADFHPPSNVIDDSGEVDEYLYIWKENENNEELLPQFRLEIETEIKKHEKTLKKLKNEGDMDKYEKTKNKIVKKIKSKLENPKKLLELTKKDYEKKKEQLSSFLDYLDTNERKILEDIDTIILKYNKVLDKLNLVSDFNN